MTDRDRLGTVAWHVRLLGWGCVELQDSRRALFRTHAASGRVFPGDLVRVDSLRVGPLGLRLADGVQPIEHRARPGVGTRPEMLDLTGIRGLESLPAGIEVTGLVVADCDRLRHLRADMDVSTYVVAAGCRSLQTLGGWRGPVDALDLRDCPHLQRLPPSLVVRQRLEIGGLRLRELPEGCREARLTWRDLPIEARWVVGDDEALVEGVLADRDKMRREARIERVGAEALVDTADAELFDEDTDEGGPRRLVGLQCPDGSWVMLFVVRCPSTGKRHVLRVPPATNSCRGAARWIAGFDQETDVHFVQQT